ncbi:RecX family transcriptional regulator [Candidatus Saccharibacteria bacterium]|nr:RecX family transcriptional regulator [Candidatus Saccharibacteria bacterium]
MEIYSLKDSDAKIQGEENLNGQKFVVTELRQGVKNPNRVNVFIDGKYEFSLDVTQVVEYKLKKGMKLTAEQVAEYKKASEYGKLYQRTLEWVLTRPRSERETRDYLRKKIYDKKLDNNYIEKIIEKLKLKKYLDDEKFAEWYVENRFVKKGVSIKRLKMELMKKGVKRELAEATINKIGRGDETEIKKIVAKKRTRYDDERLISYLVRQGFDYHLAQTVVRENHCETD